MYDDYPTVIESTVENNMIYLIILGIILIGILVFSLISLAKVFKKANRSGISAIIPIYNIMVLLEITNYPKWYLLLYFIPGANIIIHLMIMMKLSKLFKKGNAFGFGLTFLPFIFFPILAFNDSEYIGINLVAMEGKEIVAEVPKLEVTEKDEKIVNEEVDTSSKNINISIGGGVYQKDYTNNLLQVDQTQTIIHTKPNNPVDLLPKTNPSTFINPISEKEVENTETPNTNMSTAIKFPEPIHMINSEKQDNPTISPIETEINILKESNPVTEKNPVNATTEYISCPKCGARIKSDAKVCFLCGRRLD